MIVYYFLMFYIYGFLQLIRTSNAIKTKRVFYDALAILSSLELANLLTIVKLLKIESFSSDILFIILFIPIVIVKYVVYIYKDRYKAAFEKCKTANSTFQDLMLIFSVLYAVVSLYLIYAVQSS
jgi:hypothetical protein